MNWNGFFERIYKMNFKKIWNCFLKKKKGAIKKKGEKKSKNEMYQIVIIKILN